MAGPVRGVDLVAFIGEEAHQVPEAKAVRSDAMQQQNRCLAARLFRLRFAIRPLEARSCDAQPACVWRLGGSLAGIAWCRPVVVDF